MTTRASINLHGIVRASAPKVRHHQNECHWVQIEFEDAEGHRSDLTIFADSAQDAHHLYNQLLGIRYEEF